MKSKANGSASTGEKLPVGMNVRVTAKLWWMSLLLPMLTSFFVGQAARRYILLQMATLHSPSSGVATVPGILLDDTNSLPPPKVREDKEVPMTVYTSKITDTAASSSARTMILEKKPWQECVLDENYEALGKTCQVSKATAAKYKDDDDDDDDDDAAEEELHMPAGQHLLVDIKNVNHDFLNSEQRLAQAMVDVVWESDLTLLSYHCHKLFPMGVSCVGVLLESHISFHTWPENGVITLDLFTCGSGLLIPILPLIERLFAIPGGEEEEPPTMIWIHKLRGFRNEDDALQRHLGSSNLAYEILGVMDMDMKKEVATVKTAFQMIDIWDVIKPKFQSIDSYRKSQSNDESYEANHPELYLPDRQVYLDGTMQSTRKGNEAYHEALVHPGLFAHSNPRRVAIIGGGEGATLREILKHKTVEHVKMIEIDKDMIETSRKYLPDWNQCNDIFRSTHSCFDDPRADVLSEDALAWFIDRFSSKKTVDGEERFDVIFMDALDPQDDVPFAEVLYSNFMFTEALFNALTDDGILIMQLGVAPFTNDPPDEFSRSHNRAKLINGLQEFGFESIQTYEEAHCGFGDPWLFLVVCKDYGCRQNWYANSAEISVAIRKRLLPSVSGKPSLKYFDGATMNSYRPHKAYETIFCRRPNPAVECQHLPFISRVERESFEVKPSMNLAVNFVRMQTTPNPGVFATVDIPKGTMLLHGESSIHFYPTTADLIHKTLIFLTGRKSYKIEPLIMYLLSYSSQNYIFGSRGYGANSNILSLANHGCNGTHTITVPYPSCRGLTELTADPSKLPTSNARYNSKGRFPSSQLFNPVVERHLPHLTGGYYIADRDLSAGDEILDNYLASVTLKDNWENVVKELRRLCEGEYYTRKNSCSGN